MEELKIRDIEEIKSICESINVKNFIEWREGLRDEMIEALNPKDQFIWFLQLRAFENPEVEVWE